MIFNKLYIYTYIYKVKLQISWHLPLNILACGSKNKDIFLHDHNIILIHKSLRTYKKYF